ncbi:MAG: methyl-accepting chemotaxis protein [Brevinematales bacterium]|nr:methyl-accepting chemotaxis protein [Brevinematales bacterium]
MNTRWRQGIFLGGCLLMLVSFVLSVPWIGIPGLVLCIFGGWPTQHAISSPPSSLDQDFFVLQKALEELFLSLAQHINPNEEQKKAFFEAWHRLSNNDIKAMVSLLSQAKTLFETSPPLEESDTFSPIQKAFYKLPYLRILLLNVIEKTEEATNTLIERFISVSEKNRHTLEEVQKRIGNHQGDSLSYLIDQSREITQNYQLMKEEYEHLISQNEKQITDFSHHLHTMFDQLKNINDILSQNKIIAVNLSIEGVKFGEKGRAIKVIVKEIQKLNQKIDQFTAEVSHRLEQFELFNKELWNNWLHHMEESVTKFQTASENASALMEKLRSASQHMNDISLLLQQNASDIQKDLDAIVESLQFQDITRQQIENVMSYLGQIQDDIKKGSAALTHLGITLDEWDIEKMDEAKNDMIREAKVSSERFLLK